MFELAGISLLVLTILGFILPLLALIDIMIMRKKFENSDRLIWILIVIFVPVLGSVLYFAIGRKQTI